MRGVYQKPEGSEIWWINYYAAGKRHREKVGRKSDAIKLYQLRKADVIAGRKLPELRDSKVVRFSELIDDVLEYVADHKDVRKLTSAKPRSSVRLSAQGLRQRLPLRSSNAGSGRIARQPATTNRYKAFISLCYREGVHNNKTTINPARQVRHRRGAVGRLRFLSREDYDKLYKIIERRFPEHLAEFIISVSTGMRLSEQYSLTWGQVHLDRRTIDLTKTKNGSARTVHLNADSVAAFQTLEHKLHKPADPVFVRQGPRFDTRSWFVPCLQEAEIEGYVWHCNRHTFCSWLAMAGASIKEIQELAGHKTITMSAQYSHLSPEHRLSVIDRIVSPAIIK